MTPAPLLRLGPWAVDHIAGGPDLVISFASIGHDPTRRPSPEFVRTATEGGRAALFVMDRARSWGTEPGFAEVLAAAVDQVAPQGRVLAMGTSMGAFLALKAAGAVRLDAVLAIGPQHQPAAAWETRWQTWTKGLPPDLTAPVPEGVWTVTIHGQADDMAQAERFTPAANLDRLVVPGVAHADLARHLKTRGGLQGLVQAALAGDRRRLLRIAAEAGAVRLDR